MARWIVLGCFCFKKIYKYLENTPFFNFNYLLSHVATNHQKIQRGKKTLKDGK